MNWDYEMKKIIRAKWKTGEIFSLNDIYLHERHFSELYPDNRHVRDKMRQVLQHLRDDGVVEFIDDQGNYRLII